MSNTNYNYNSYSNLPPLHNTLRTVVPLPRRPEEIADNFGAFNLGGPVYNGEKFRSKQLQIQQQKLSELRLFLLIKLGELKNEVLLLKQPRMMKDSILFNLKLYISAAKELTGELSPKWKWLIDNLRERTSKLDLSKEILPSIYGSPKIHNIKREIANAINIPILNIYTTKGGRRTKRRRQTQRRRH